MKIKMTSTLFTRREFNILFVFLMACMISAGCAMNSGRQSQSRVVRTSEIVKDCIITQKILFNADLARKLLSACDSALDSQTSEIRTNTCLAAIGGKFEQPRPPIRLLISGKENDNAIIIGSGDTHYSVVVACRGKRSGSEVICPLTMTAEIEDNLLRRIRVKGTVGEGLLPSEERANIAVVKYITILNSMGIQ